MFVDSVLTYLIFGIVLLFLCAGRAPESGGEVVIVVREFQFLLAVSALFAAGNRKRINSGDINTCHLLEGTYNTFERLFVNFSDLEEDRGPCALVVVLIESV